MKMEISYLKPSLTTFFRILSLSLIILLSFKTITSIFYSPIFNEPKLLVFPSILISIALTIYLRKSRLTIMELDDLHRIKSLLIEKLKKNGLKIKEEKENEITLELINRIGNFFNVWFGTETTTIKLVNNKIIVESNLRVVRNLVHELDNH
ncbi:MAG: hypothetical protein O9340_03960 [Cyclobacteriaceae bacterium]|jgi:hypothetical protein|nr:hypothetical protein [Cyclobacteriaceae bacterium]